MKAAPSTSDEEVGVLLRLHDQLDEGQSAMSASQIVTNFKPPMKTARVKEILQSLLVRGLVTSSGLRSDTVYKISRRGVIEVEATHEIAETIDPGTNVVYRSYTAKANPTSASIDWSKWGTIAAVIGIPITIAGIAVAIWLDYN